MRNEAWREQGSEVKALELGYFERPETVGHLRRRQPSIDPAGADELAAELGDLPPAMAAADASRRLFCMINPQPF